MPLPPLSSNWTEPAREDNRRTAPRVHTQGPTCYMADVVNLSRDGALFDRKAAPRWREGEIVPVLLGDPELTLRCNATVAWASAVRRGRQRAGLKLHLPDDAARRMIVQIMRRYVHLGSCDAG